MKLTEAQVLALRAKICKWPLLVQIGGVDLGPLDGPPTIEPDVETLDLTMYETEAEVQARYLTRNDLTLTLNTRNIDKLMELHAGYKQGDDLLDPARSVEIVLVPITEDATAKTLTFPKAFLNAGLSYSPGDNAAHTGQLVFNCKPDAATGIPFAWGAGE